MLRSVLSLGSGTGTKEAEELMAEWPSGSERQAWSQLPTARSMVVQSSAATSGDNSECSRLEICHGMKSNSSQANHINKSWTSRTLSALEPVWGHIDLTPWWRCEVNVDVHCQSTLSMSALRNRFILSANGSINFSHDKPHALNPKCTWIGWFGCCCCFSFILCKKPCESIVERTNNWWGEP